jgi:hypothetical protein
MPIINHASDQRSVRANNPNQSQANVPLPPSTVTPATLEALLRSEPNDTRPFKKPDGLKTNPTDTASTALDFQELGAQINQETVRCMLRDPTSKSSKALSRTLNSLVTQEKISALLKCTKNGNATAKTLNEIKNHVNKDTIDTAMTPIESEQIQAYAKAVDSALFNLKYSLMNAAPSARFDMTRSFANRPIESVQEIEAYLKDVASIASGLCSIAEVVEALSGSLKFAENIYVNNPRSDDDVNRARTDRLHQSHIYSYARTDEGSIDTPSEIRKFVHGRDKIDVSGIRKQLGKVLESVNQFSGASGEILVKYSNLTETSVLAISGNNGEPAFVAKVFGKLTEKDLLT